jgi:hypothetical protein
MTYLEALLTFPPGSIVTDRPNYKRPVRHFKVVEVLDIPSVHLGQGPKVAVVTKKMHTLRGQKYYTFVAEALTFIKESNSQ